MLYVEWIQSDRILLHRELNGAIFLQLSWSIEEAVRDLLIAIAFNEDWRIHDIQLNEPLPLRIYSSSSNYYSGSHVSDLGPYAFSLGGTADTFASFLTAHIYHASVLEYELSEDYWPIQTFLDNSVSTKQDICISIDSDQQYVAMSFGITWVENRIGESVLLTDGGFRADKDFYGLTPSNDLISALERPLKFMRAYTCSKGKCSICNSIMSIENAAFCENCRVNYCLPAETRYQGQSLLDIQSFRGSQLCCKRYLSSHLEQHYSINQYGRLVIDSHDIPF